MVEHLAFFLLGLGDGGVFAALALALVVTYRSSGTINIATGAIALYVAENYALLRNSGDLFNPVPGFGPKLSLGTPMGLAPAVVISLLVAALLGVVLYLAVFRPMRGAPAVARLVASVGVTIALQGLIGIRLGSVPVVVRAILPTDVLDLGGTPVRMDRVWFAVTIVALAVALSAFFRFTRFGLASRAVAETEQGAIVSGLDPERIALANWALSAVVAGLAGILIAPVTPILPTTYTLFIVPALAAALVGNFTNIGRAVVAGLAIGMSRSWIGFMATKADWLPATGLPEMVPLLIVLLLLVLRGRNLPGRGAVLVHALGRAPRPSSPYGTAAVVLVAGLVGAAVLNGRYLSAFIVTLIMGVLALSWVVVTGYAGQVSLAQLTFAGCGSFALHRMAETLSIPFPIAPLLAATVAMVIGVIVGLPALRVRGLSLAVVTLAAAAGIEALWFRNGDFNGGLTGAGVGPPSLFGYEMKVGLIDNRFPFAAVCLVVLILAGVGVATLRRSALGAAMLAVKANERSAAAAGVNVARTKLLAFAIGSWIAGLAGALIAYNEAGANAASFSTVLGLAVFATVYLGGITSVSGAGVAGLLASGGLALVALDELVGGGEYYQIVMGLALVLTVVRYPEGLAGAVLRLLHPRRATDLAEPDVAVTPGGDALVEHQMPRPDENVLTIKSVSVRYGGVHAVDDVSLCVARGTIAGLIGPNGAGKTTLIDAISGYATCSGEVDFGGTKLNGLGPHRRARAGLARTFQGVELYEDMTVEENVRVGLQAASDREDAKLHIDGLLEMLQLDRLRSRAVSELSAGYRQLVSVARALAGRPAMLLLDEPAGGLDSSESAWLGQVLRRVRASGVSVLVVDHDTHLMLGLCDVIHVLDLGRLIASGPPAAIRADPEVTGAYLGSRA